MSKSWADIVEENYYPIKPSKEICILDLDQPGEIDFTEEEVISWRFITMGKYNKLKKVDRGEVQLYFENGILQMKYNSDESWPYPTFEFKYHEWQKYYQTIKKTMETEYVSKIAQVKLFFRYFIE
jgi:hypothetical protein